MAARGRTRRSPTDTIALDLYALDGIDWTAVRDDQSDAISRALRDQPLRGRTPNRLGITYSKTIENAVYGYFTQEYQDVLRQLADDKTVTESLEPNTVDLVFMIRMDTGFLLLQDRRFRNEGLLSIGESRRRFETVLRAAARSARLEIPTMRPVEYVQIPKGEFLEVLRREEVVELDVDNLAGRLIPDDAVIFNPEVNNESFLRDVWHTWETPNVSRMRMTGAPGGNLGDSKVARAASQAGNPREIVYTVEAGGRRRKRRLRQVQKTHISGVRVHRPISEDDARRILDILEDVLAGSLELEERLASRPRQLELQVEEETV